MADMLQDLYGLQYSPSFTIEGQQEADVNLSLPPHPVPWPRSMVPSPTASLLLPTPPSSSSTVPDFPTVTPSPTPPAPM